MGGRNGGEEREKGRERRVRAVRKKGRGKMKERRERRKGGEKN